MLAFMLSFAAAMTPMQANQSHSCHGYTTPDANACAIETLEEANASLKLYTDAARDRAAKVASGKFANAGEAEALTAFDRATKEWEKYRDAECRAVSSEYAGGTISGSIGTMCLVELTQLRTHVIWEKWLVALDGSTNTPEPPLPKPVHVRAKYKS